MKRFYYWILVIIRYIFYKKEDKWLYYEPTGYLVDVYIASLWRQGHCVKTIKSFLCQQELGTITVSCNNYTDDQWTYVKNIILDPRVTFVRTQNEKGSNEKLRFIGDGTNHYLCLADDDIIYPRDYLHKLIDACDKHNAYVGLHGRVLPNRKIKSYYNDYKVVYRALRTVIKDREVDIVSNCGSLFKRSFFDDLDSWYGQCSTTSMDDLHTNRHAKDNGIKRMVIAHKRNYLKHKIQVPIDDYVYERYKNNDLVQTDFVNQYFIT